MAARGAARRPGAARRGATVGCRAAAAVRDPTQRVVITGIGLASVFGQDPDVFYDKLLAGTSGASMIEKFDASAMSTQFAAYIKDYDVEGYIDRKNARRMDDCLKYAIVSSRQALEQAGLEKDGEAFNGLDKERCGVLVGSGMGGLTVYQDGVKNYFTKGWNKITPFFIPYAISNMGGAMVAMDVGFMGPCYSISTACATANYCFKNAADHIRNGIADVMIAGGVEAPVIPTGIGGFIACRALSGNNDDPTGASRPWDKARDGFVMGEGSGVLVMESLEHAQKRGANIICEYLGGGFSCDAHHMTEPRQDGQGVANCINMALADAGIDKEQVNYINAHATSTPAGDLVEINAVKKVFTDTAQEGLHMNATKSMTGHALGAAGGLEAVVCIKAMERSKLHPSINCDDPEELIANGKINACIDGAVDLDVTAAMSNSFGFGGHNGTVIFAPFKE